MKPLWKVTFTYLSLSALQVALITGTKPKPPTWTKVYRWKWRAKLAALPMPGIAGSFIVAKVEPYWPSAANVVALRAA